jgi:hypothetical protein
MELLTNPIIWLLASIVAVAVIEVKKSKKCSTKSQGANKTSCTSKPTRARTSKGKFVADNPTTPKNEAWEGGKAPKKKTTRKTATKKTAKKKVAKKRVTKKTTTKKSSADKN